VLAARAARADRQRDKALARRCELCAQNQRKRMSIVQETLAPQVFSLITHSTIDVRARPQHGVAAGEKRPARTLSRELWQ